MLQGQVNVLVILGGNPVYDAPADLNFAEAVRKVEHRLRLGLYADETSRLCTWQLPRAHYLESWGDARSYDGLVCLQQPLIEPLYGGKTPVELLATLTGDDLLKGYDLVRRTFKQWVPEGADFEKTWRRAVHDGSVANSQYPLFVHEPRPAVHLPESVEIKPGALELSFRADAKLYDGRFANNGWLQELPDPLTKVTWESVALISPSTAKELDIGNETLIRLKYRGRELELTACYMPGQAPGTVVVSLGYGRTSAGHVGGHDEWSVAPVGANACGLRTFDAPWGGDGLVIEATGRSRPLAVTQNHHAIDTIGMRERAKRAIQLVREGTLAQFVADAAFAQKIGPQAEEFSLWKEFTYEGYKWGMAIDLSRCTGCSACVVACQSENNIPIVGRENVLVGREMHWLRIDRYFKGDEDRPSIAQQPVACHHCELAPCEQVCPVAATVHDSEGLNVMVYNRCVGTRYCSNNCPYKVRRFNYFNYQKQVENDPQEEVRKLANNPEVSVRARGVMEKCSYCLQRIQAVRIKAKNEGRPVKDGEVVPACMQACPTGAISFGDLNNRESDVVKQQSNPRAYGMLAEINVRPRTRYLARVRNTHPDLT
jgi:molybdopterin-containing oxidoreductase family iron-sulfur binding subunit